MGTLAHHLAVVQHQNQIRIPDGADSLGHNEAATLKSYLELADDYTIEDYVENVCRFVQRDFWEAKEDET